jgi:uncharacterized membrane protein
MDATMRVAELRASRGPAWIAAAGQLFRRAPIAWISICFGWIGITIFLVLMPLIGLVIASLLQPVFFASFAITAFRQAAGEPVTTGDLFRGFRRNLRSLVALGSLLFLAEILVVLVMAALGLPGWPGDRQFDAGEYIEMLRGREWVLATGFALSALVKGALWFAPPLIAFHEMPVSHAIRWSVYAALSNFGAMLLYGLALAALFLVCWLTFGLAFLVVLPLMAISTFVGYREVFEPAPIPP